MQYVSAGHFAGDFGQEGVEIALDILQGELIRNIQLAGTASIEKITRDFVIGH
jgi:isopentenyl diphosphate isomerase/L-lactate dehydrogenase-like FMN-dependent dehydrogenase